MRSFVFAALLALVSCNACRVDPDIDSFSCEHDADCLSPYRCLGGTCSRAGDVLCVDDDEDGFGVGEDSLRVDCPKCANLGLCDEDCDDNDASIAPDLHDVCDGKDNNCNDEIDEPVACEAALDCPDEGSLVPTCDSDVCVYRAPNTTVAGCEEPIGCVDGAREMLAEACY